MIEKKKPVCIHFHIFKNAGTTIDSALQKNFSNQHLTMDDKAKSPSDIFSWEQVLPFLNQHKDVKAFSSHIIRFPLPESNYFNFLPMVFLRHPLDRIFSIYSYHRRKDDVSQEHKQICKTKTISEFIDWGLKQPNYATMKNFQTLYLSRENYVNPQINLEDFNLALERIQNCTVVGVVDRLDESLVLAEETLKPYFSGIDLTGRKLNVSPDRMGSLLEKLESSKKQIGNNLYNKLLEHNEYDLRLYNSANEELDNRISKITKFEKKLKNFCERKKMLTKKSGSGLIKNLINKYKKSATT